MAEIVGIDFVTAYNQLQISGGVLVLDCRLREDWEEDHLTRSLPCPITLKDVEAGSSLLEVIQETLYDLPVLVKRATKGRLERKMLYGDSERTMLVGKLLREWNPRSKIFLVKSEELARLRERAAFCFTNLDAVEKRKFRRRSHPNLILGEGLWLGTASQATNREIVQDLGVSHILNISKSAPCQFEKDDQLCIEYLHIKIDDQTDVNIAIHIPAALAFIKKGLEHGSGVLVHCMCGVSRSVSLVLAWLIAKKGMSLKQAFDFVVERRPVACPNPGFLKQLGEFEMSVRGSNTHREVHDLCWYGEKDGEAKSADQSRLCQLV